MSAPFRTGISVVYAGARWHVLHVPDAETVLLRSDTGQELAADPMRIRLPACPTLKATSPGRLTSCVLAKPSGPRRCGAGLNHPLIFHESFQCGRIACPAITRLSSPGCTTRTACRCSDVASP